MIREERVAPQFMALTICMLASLLGLIEPQGVELGRNVWMARLIAILVALAVYLLFASLKCSWKPKALPALLAAAYSALLAVVILIAASRFWLVWSQSTHSQLFVVIVLAIVTIYGAHRGHKAILRTALVVAIGFVAVVIFNTLMLSPSIEFDRMRIVAVPEMRLLLQTALRYTIVFLLPLPALLWIVGAENDSDAAKKGVRRGAVAAAIYFAVESIRNVLLLGDLIVLDSLPLLRTLKMVEIGIGLSRVEFIGIFMLMMVSLCGAMALAVSARNCFSRFGEKYFPKIFHKMAKSG